MYFKALFAIRWYAALKLEKVKKFRVRAMQSKINTTVPKYNRKPLFKDTTAISTKGGVPILQDELILRELQTF